METANLDNLIAQMEVLEQKYQQLKNSSDANRESLVKEIKEMEDETKEMQNQLGVSGKIVSAIQTRTSANKSLQQQLRETKSSLAELNLQGKTNSEEYQKLVSRAGELTNALGDASTAAKLSSSDTQALSVVMGAASVGTGGFALATSAMELFGANTEDVELAQKKLQTAIAAVTGVQSIATATNKDSALMIGIMKIQSNSLAKAKELEAVATGKATIAQKLFNAIAKANPYVLLAAAIVTVVGALAAFSIGQDESKSKVKSTNDALSDQQQAVKEAAKAWDEYNKGNKIKSMSKKDLETKKSELEKSIKEYDSTISEEEKKKNKYLSQFQETEAVKVQSKIDATKALSLDASTELKLYEDELKLRSDAEKKQDEESEKSKQERLAAEQKYANSRKEISTNLMAGEGKDLQLEQNRYDAELKGLNDSLDKGLISKKTYDATFRAMEEQHQNNVDDIRTDWRDKRYAEETNQMVAELALKQKYSEDEITNVQYSIDQQVLLRDRLLQKEGESDAEFEARKKAYNDNILKLTNEKNELTLSASNKAAMDELKLSQKYSTDFLTNKDYEISQYKLQLDQLNVADKEYLTKKKEINDAIQQAEDEKNAYIKDSTKSAILFSIQSVNEMSDKISSSLSSMSNGRIAEAQAEAAAANNTASAQEKLAKVTEEEKEKQKKIQAAQIAIQTAMGVATAVAQAQKVGPIAAPAVAAINSAIVLATGLAQLAALKSETIKGNSTSSSSGSSSSGSQSSYVQPQLYYEGGATLRTTTAVVNGGETVQRVVIVDKDVTGAVTQVTERKKNATL